MQYDNLCLRAFWFDVPHEVAQFVASLPSSPTLARQCQKAADLRHELTALRRRAEDCGRLSHAEAQALLHDVGTAAEALVRVAMPVLCELARACRCRLACPNMEDSERAYLCRVMHLLDAAASTLRGTVQLDREASDLRLAARRFKTVTQATASLEMRRKP
jgi:hypothetical protein